MNGALCFSVPLYKERRRQNQRKTSEKQQRYKQTELGNVIYADIILKLYLYLCISLSSAHANLHIKCISLFCGSQTKRLAGVCKVRAASGSSQ